MRISKIRALQGWLYLAVIIDLFSWLIVGWAMRPTRRFCRADHLEPSMSRRGNCRDNAVAEPFFSSLEKERIRKRIDKNREPATREVSDYIESFYNRSRRHRHPGGVSPEDLEDRAKRM
jgi:putative transposase